LKIKWQGETTVGKTRKINQDAFYIEPSGIYACVADGMGGAMGGEVASNSCISAVRARLSERTLDDKTDIAEEIKWALELANEIVYELASGALRGMGTTCCMAYFKDENITFANVGDSRGYIFSKDKLRLITRDHTAVSLLLEKGEITQEEAEDHEQKNVITRAIGTESTVLVDTFTEKIAPGDIILICSDGLYHEVCDAEIEEMIKTGSAPKKMCDVANRRGGRDNTTVIIGVVTNG
jgi:protein phosphatase